MIVQVIILCILLVYFASFVIKHTHFLGSLRIHKPQFTLHRDHLTLIFWCGLVTIFFGLIGWLFYLHLLGCFVVGIFSCLAWPSVKKVLGQKKQKKMLHQFIDMHVTLSADLVAGKSLHHAYIDFANRVLQHEVLGYACLNREMVHLVHTAETNAAVSMWLSDFASRSGVDMIGLFAETLETCLVHGGDLHEVMRQMVFMMREQAMIEEEMRTLLSGRKYEQFILSMMPLILVYAMQNMAYDFVSPLFETLGGRVTMTVALAVFFISYKWSHHMTEVVI